jgi:UDP-N-acetylmuramoyl-tripeptide--D-alanyl-D-alanine ligase
LFVPVKGETHDGHRFIEAVLDKGIRGLVVEAGKSGHMQMEALAAADVSCVAVENTTVALGDMAASFRRRFEASVAAITGSMGKTTTREMMAAVLAQRYRTLSSRKNFNNEFGLPLTLFRLTPDTEWAVVELGMNHPGEISRLAEICLPDIGVITNIGPVHLEGVGSIQGVMQAKGELLDKIKRSGHVVLNMDDQRLRQLAQKTDLPTIFFGASPDAQIRSESVRERGTGISFTLVLPEETVDIDLKIPGTFMVSNALAAATVGHLLGISGPEIKAGLEAFRPIEGRMSILKTENGVHLINDTYNANPAAVKGAIETLCSLKGDRRAVFVLADMLELSDQAETLHSNVGTLVARSGIDRLYLTGQFSSAVRTGAVQNGFSADDIFIGAKDEIFENLTDWLRPGDWVLIKGSRGMSMESVVHRLVAWGNLQTGRKP